MNQALTFFEQAIKKNRLAHLYIISGPKGSGKTKLVEQICYLIFNQGSSADENTLLRHQINTYTLSNLMVIEPSGLNIKKEQILELQSEFSKTALVSGPRIYVIKNVERMNQSASNSLLKFMEEPSSHQVTGFLLTENFDDVILTIKSRAQIIHLNSLDEIRLKEQLMSEGIDEQKATILPFITKDLDDALILASDPNMSQMIEFVVEISNQWKKRDIIYPIYFSTNGRFLLQDRILFTQFMECLILYFMDLIHYRSNQPIIFEFLRDNILEQSDTMDVFEIQDLIEQLQVIYKKQNYYINLELALDEIAYILEKKR
ncbi:MAG: AAA family ATPase [Acholeplasmataceae bacterium]